MSRPQKTAADFMVIAFSPVLIMALVGSLCFFLIDVFYRGQFEGMVFWVMFWFVIAIVLVSRIAIELTPEHAIPYGICLALATSLVFFRTTVQYPVGILLLGIVWYCAHKLVFDCTLIYEDNDSSGQGLLEKKPPALPAAPLSAAPSKPGAPVKKKKFAEPGSPGRWVIYFSLAALPLFGIGQMLLPAENADAHQAGFILLAVYLAAALGLLVTTCFLGLRRYLRQRYLKMPPVIALAWLKFGIGVIVLALAGAAFLPRPGVNGAWTALRYQVDEKIRRASEYISPPNSPGEGEGRPGDQSGGQKGHAEKPSQEEGHKKISGEHKPGQSQTPPQPNPAPSPSAAPPAGNLYYLFRALFWIGAILGLVVYLIRSRKLLLEMWRSILAAIRQFLDLTPRRKAARPAAPAFAPARRSSFSAYKNPFFASKDAAWPPERIILYSFEAVQAWAAERGSAPRPEETPREFCARLGENHPEFSSRLSTLARLYSYPAYGKQMPPNLDLEPIRELWRLLPASTVVAADARK